MYGLGQAPRDRFIIAQVGCVAQGLPTQTSEFSEYTADMSRYYRGECPDSFTQYSRPLRISPCHAFYHCPFTLFILGGSCSEPFASPLMLLFTLFPLPRMQFNPFHLFHQQLFIELLLCVSPV